MDDRENASQPIKTGLAPISIWCLQRGKTKEEYANSKKDRRENQVQDSIDAKHAVSTEDDCHNSHDSSADLVKLGCRQRRSLEAVSSKAASFHQEQSYSGKSKADEPSQA